MNTENEEVSVNSDLTLDPKNWKQMRDLGHRMVDDMMDYLEGVGSRPSWKPIPQEVKQALQVDIPQHPQDIDEIYAEFKKNIFPYNKGNVHPRFFAWVQGTGTPLGALSDFLAATMNPNVTIGEHAAMYVDGQVVDWCKQMLNFPKDGSGILLSGGSMANITALTVARNYQGEQIRKNGLKNQKQKMVLYCSTETHSCVIKAAEIIGLGTNGVRKINVNESYQMDVVALEKTIKKDIENGILPMCVVATTGTVNTGAIDPLAEIYRICNTYRLWFHIDGAYGALCKLDPKYKNELLLIEKADSVAFDLHKWLYIPYEVGCALFKDADAHRNSFTITPNYLLQESRGLAGGPEPINNFGFELSRGFKALKVWMSLKEHGLKKYASLITQNNRQAEYLGTIISKEPHLRLLAPVAMSIVCYQFVGSDLKQDQTNDLNKEILISLQEKGIASPSSTILKGQYAIRVCIVNHRTKKADLDLLINKTVAIGMALLKNKNAGKLIDGSPNRGA